MSDSSPGGGEAEGPCVGEVVWAVACSSVSHWPAPADSMSPLPQATICSSGCCRSLHGGSPLVGRCLVGNVRSSVPSPLISFSAFSLLCCATASLLVYFEETNETESDNWIDNCRNHPLSFCCFFFFLFSIISIYGTISIYRLPNGSFDSLHPIKSKRAGGWRWWRWSSKLIRWE